MHYKTFTENIIKSQKYHLMNIDLKITTKDILATYLKKQIQHDLVGFIPGIQGCFKIVKLIDIIYQINDTIKISENVLWVIRSI